jgi:hypothetical protein
MAADVKAAPSSDRGGPSLPPAPAFVPVRIAATAPAAPSPPSPPAPAASCVGQVEIVIGDCIVRVSGTIEAQALSATLATVFAAVRRTS